MIDARWAGMTPELCEAAALLWRAQLYCEGRAGRQRQDEMRKVYTDAANVIRQLREDISQ